MFRIAIVDDSKDITEIVRAHVKRQAANAGMDQEVMVRTYTKPRSLLEEMQGGMKFHIFILDMEMPEINGVELSDRIREIQSKGYIIFLTCHASFAPQGYEKGAYQYVLKPDMERRLPHVLDSVLAECKREMTEYYQITNQHRIERMRCSEIIYVKKDGKNCTLFTERSQHFDRKTLDQVRQVLSRVGFIAIDRGRIVNIEHIRKIEKNEVHMDNGEVLEISRSNIKKVKNMVTEYWRDNL